MPILRSKWHCGALSVCPCFVASVVLLVVGDRAHLPPYAVADLRTGTRAWPPRVSYPGEVDQRVAGHVVERIWAV